MERVIGAAFLFVSGCTVAVADEPCPRPQPVETERAEEADEFWTPERLREAQPLDLPTVEQELERERTENERCSPEDPSDAPAEGGPSR